MSTLKAHNIEPATGTDVALGAAGDSITVSGDSLKLNTFKDSGGNTLFSSDGAGTLSNVNSGFKGDGPILIQTQTASGASSLSFTSGLTSTYDKYMFVFINMNPATNAADFTFQASTDGGSSYGVTITSSYFDASNTEDGTNNLSYRQSFDLAQSGSYQTVGGYIGNGSDESYVGELHLFNPSNTTYVKHFYIRGNLYYGGADASVDSYAAGYFNTTSALNALNFKMSTGNFDGKIKMYGIV